MIIYVLYHTHLIASGGPGMVLARARIYSGYAGMKQSGLFAEAGEATLFQERKDTSYVMPQFQE